MTVADRIAVMDHGRIVQVATPREIYERPASRYVADFIGDINIFEGRVGGIADGALRIDVPAAAAVVAVSAEAAAPGAKAWFAIRPEKVAISHEPPPDGVANRVRGAVWDIVYLGDASVYHVRLATGATMKAAVANRARRVMRPIAWDDEVWLSWTPDDGVVLRS